MKTKLKARELSSISFADYSKEFKRLIPKLKNEATSLDTAIDIFIKQNHKFSDGIEHPFILPAKLDPSWKKEAKAAIKSEKKFTMVGAAFVEIDNGIAKLCILPKVGGAKLPKVAKEAKGLLKKNKLQIEQFDATAMVEELRSGGDDAEKVEALLQKIAGLLAKLGITVQV